MKLLACLLSLVAAHVFAAPVPIFDGQTLAGWDADPKIWRVEDGMITGGSTTEKIPANYFICTQKSYANFDLRLKIKCSGDPATGLINSGLQIRSVRVPNGAHMCGYQVDCGDGWFGKIYDEFRRNRVIAQPVDAAALDRAVDVFGWNEYRIRAEGARIQAWINGVLAIDYTEEGPNIALDGQLGPQVHSGGVALVQMKDVTIEELPPTPNAPTWKSLGGYPAALAKLAPPKKAAAAPTQDSDARENAVAGVKPMKQGNAPTAGKANTPEEERATFTLPAGFTAELVAAEDPANGIGKFVPLAFDQHGALWTTTALEYPVDGNENPAAADALYASKAKDKVLIYDRDPKSPTGYATKPRVFLEGLAIPLGVLPYKNGCYVLHGHDIIFAEDTNADGKADKTTVILSGFGVQDSHLFPHQFMRAPGGWIWMAQGLFNRSAVKTSDGKTVEFDMCRMAKFRPDGSQFEPTSVGPNNIWGLVLNGEGEAFIQEANDYGYPVMPFHEYAYYPGGAERLAKSYQPPFPPAADFRMGGTGLSGLALTDKNGPFPEPWRDMMLVANPITNRVQAIKMHRDGPYWKLDNPVDFLVSSDPWFRPVAISIGPDGCLYIVDWYNKIISHNEVPRNHPDRDKTRGRIWRIKPTAAKPFDVPDFTKLSGDELIAKLGSDSLAQSHMAWQALADGGISDWQHDNDAELQNRNEGKLRVIIREQKQSADRRIQALWALKEVDRDHSWITEFPELAKDPNRNVRRELVRMDQDSLYTAVEEVPKLACMLNDPDPEVRAQLLRTVGDRIRPDATESIEDSLIYGIGFLLAMVHEPIDSPTAPSTRNGKPIKVREAYDRDFERYLVRMSLERSPKAVATFLDMTSKQTLAALSQADDRLYGSHFTIQHSAFFESPAGTGLPAESILLAALALDPKASAARVAKLLPQLQRAPGQEEVMRLAQFPEEPGVGEALRAMLANPKTSAAALESLVAMKTRLDAQKLAPYLTDASATLLASKDETARDLGVRLAAAFQLHGAEAALVALVQSGTQAPAALRALAEIGSDQTELFAKLVQTSPDPAVRDEALLTLAGSKAADAPQRIFALYAKLTPTQQKKALERLSPSKVGAHAILAALAAGVVPAADIDASLLDRMQAVLGPDDAALARLVDSLGALFRPLLALDGTDAAWTQTSLTLEGPCTIEAWVRLDPQGRKVSSSDSIAGAPGQLDFNFFAERARIYAFPPLGDVAVAKKPIMPGLWTHVAATRDSAGIWRLFIDGELDATGAKAAPGKIENLRLAWNTAGNGTQGALAEVRVWNRDRSAVEIRAACDRTLPEGTPGLVFTTSAGSWGQLQAGAKVVKTSDFPPILTPDEAAALDAKYAMGRALAEKPGDPAKGKVVAALCQACHLMGSTGGNIGPNLSGVGAMGTEAILRNILQPNAAMENGYRIYRVEMNSGDIVDALFVGEEKGAVIVRMPGSEDRRIPKQDIRGAKYLRRSLMPEGLLDTMTPEQITDLFAFLKTLK